MLSMRMANTSFVKTGVAKIPNAGDGEAVEAAFQVEVPQAEIYAQLLAKVESLQETVGE